VSLIIGLVGSVLVLVLVARLRLSFFMAVCAQLVLMLIGLAMIADSGEGSWRAFYLSCFGLVFFIFGHWLGTSIRRHSKPCLSTSHAAPVSNAAVWAVTVFAGSLGMYHLVVSGIPLFSSSIETQRFDFTSSGLFGIPGRMYLYGITIAWVLASINASNQGVRWRNSGPWRLATFFFLFSAGLSGFKGELIVTAIVVIGVYVVLSGRTIRLGGFLARYSWIAFILIIYFFGVAALYTTYKNSDRPLATQLLERATTVGAQPGQYAIDGRTIVQLHNPLVSDLNYYTMKYSGHSVEGMFTLDRLVSSSILRIDPSSSDRTPPVTIGAFAELVYGYGAFVAYIAYLLFGFLMAMCDGDSRTDSMKLLVRIVCVLAICNFIIKGGIVYTIINYAVVALILSFIVLVVDGLVLMRNSYPTRLELWQRRR
jgi:hypothetical protein